MPLFAGRLTVPANTPESSPVTLTIQTTEELLVSGGIVFPSGCAGLVFARLETSGATIAPLPAGWIAGNGDNVNWQDNRLLVNHSITLRAYSLDDTYPHTLELRAVVMPKSTAAARGVY